MHDELILALVTEELKLVKKALLELLVNVAKLGVPLLAEVGIGLNWD